MSLTFHVDIVSTETAIFSGVVHMLVAPTEMGEIGVLARHAPLLARLRPGLVRVLREPDFDESFFVSGGFVEVQPHIVTILADTVLRTAEFDETAARAAKARTEEAMKLTTSKTDYDHLMAELIMETALLQSIEKMRARRQQR
ncbi:MAG: F0F1 ATP synthase subunit epsilon [Sulfuricaulis sp.]|nr:F0F1 ATP synthase subunit epsilon [Sulfuricaulis sp.]